MPNGVLGDPVAAGAGTRSHPVLLLIGFAVIAGCIHAAVAPEHFDEAFLHGLFFAVLAPVQLGLAVWIYRRPEDRRALVASTLVNLGVVAVWVVSRTVGVPVGPDAWRPEAVGVVDVVATVDELAIAAYAAAIVRPPWPISARFAWLTSEGGSRLGFMLLSSTLFLAMFSGGHHHH